MTTENRAILVQIITLVVVALHAILTSLGGTLNICPK